jgi:beta-glucosidase
MAIDFPRLSCLLLSMLVAVGAGARQHAWLDEGLPDTERITALIAAMTVEEKMSQLLADSPGIERLGVLPYNWWNEALHGVARNGRATVFPQPIGLAATFDEDLVFRVATAISDEARAKFNIAQGMGNYSRYAGLTFWSPNVNLFRDPRWGRGMETYGEDPYLQARLGTAFVKGLQGDDPEHMKAAACAKHFVVHSGPEALRHEFDAVAPKRDFYESYLPAFAALVREGGVECVMCAYNRTYGEPACGSELLLKDILRGDWGFKGHVVSDCGAVRDFHRHHKVAAGPAEAAARALKAGTDLNCGSSYEALPEALDRGLVSEADIDTALRRLLTTRMKLGLFDARTAWSGLGADTVEREAHVALAREAAQKSIVLLKNANAVLPLDRGIRNLYVTGPHAASNEVLIGNYYGLSGDLVSILEGIIGKVSAGTTVRYKYGQLPYGSNVNPAGWATGNARLAQATIAVLGVSGLLEGEEGSAIASPSKGDRLELDLPQEQLNYLRKLREASANPLIVVLTGGSPFTTPEIEDLADAILFAWYPGQQGGAAVADVIFGDVNPAGRLPITFPVSVDQLPPFEDYGMQGRTYRYMREQPLYPFGYGLSYTRFEYGRLRLSATRLRAGEPLQAEVTVRNAGSVDGTEIVQLYLSAEGASFETPISTLVGVRPVTIPAGGQANVRFMIEPGQMRVFDSEGEALFAKGAYTLRVGGVSPGRRGEELTGSTLQSAQFELE